MPVEHIGLGVPDVEAALAFYDELMPLVGFERCFGNGYRPEGFDGTQIFFYDATDHASYPRHRAGLQHLAFLVATRKAVDRVHEWAIERGADVVREPHARPRYGPDCYSCFVLDSHGFMIEIITHGPTATS